jgi:hypothetical protein
VTSLRFWAIESQSSAAINAVKPWLAALQPVAVLAVCSAGAYNWLGVRRRWVAGTVVVATLVGFAAANSVLYPHFDRPELREQGRDSDIDDQFILAAGNALRLRSPYADPLYTGNPISEGPAWVILNAPFGTRDTFFAMAPVYAALLALALWRSVGPAAAALSLLVALASVGLWESAFGASLSAAGFAIATATLVLVEWRDRTVPVVLAALLIGAVSTVRLTFVCLPALVALLLWRPGAGPAARTVLVVGTMVGLGSHLIFWAQSTGAYSPLHLIGQSMDRLKPAGLLGAAALAAAVVWITRRIRLSGSADVLLWQGLGLFGPFAIVALESVVHGGLASENWPRYLAPAIPSLAAADAIRACCAPHPLHRAGIKVTST